MSKLCPACDAEFVAPNWTCPSCGNEPVLSNGIRDLHGNGDRSGAFDAADSDNLASIEDNSVWFQSRNDLVRWVLSSRCGSAKTLLEIGCGNGYVLAGVQQTHPHLTLSGSELSRHALTIARERLSNAALYDFDARSIPFRAEFDVVCAFDVIEHIDQDVDVLRQMRMACAPAGMVVVTVPQHRLLWSESDTYAGHKRRYSRTDLLERMRAAGLTPTLVTSFASTALPLMAVSRSIERITRRPFDPGREHLQAQRANAILRRLYRLDLRLIRRGHSLRFGGSLLVGAQPSTSVSAHD